MTGSATDGHCLERPQGNMKAVVLDMGQQKTVPPTARMREEIRPLA